MRSRTGPSRQEALVNNARSRVEVSQIQAELPKNGDPVDPATRAQGFDALDPTLGHLPGDRASRFEFANQKSIKVKEDFLAGDSPPASGLPCFQKGLESESEGTAKKTTGHKIISFPARAWSLPGGFLNRPWHK
jgi:hypothetical protein